MKDLKGYDGVLVGSDFYGSSIKNADSSKMLKEGRLKRLLEIVNRFESQGKGFFNRSGNDMNIWVRGKHGNDPNQWKNANELVREIGHISSQPKPDPQSGHLLIKCKGVYP